MEERVQVCTRRARASDRAGSGPVAISEKGAKGGKCIGDKDGFLGKCFKCGGIGHRKQTCAKVGAVDEEAP